MTDLIKKAAESVNLVGQYIIVRYLDKYENVFIQIDCENKLFVRFFDGSTWNIPLNKAKRAVKEEEILIF